jgi:hypothetical protein
VQHRTNHNDIFTLLLLQVEGVGGGGELGGVWEFPRSRLRLQTVLGEGNFGKVRTTFPKILAPPADSHGCGGGGE